jgi:hypothetical protein
MRVLDWKRRSELPWVGGFQAQFGINEGTSNLTAEGHEEDSTRLAPVVACPLTLLCTPVMGADPLDPSPLHVNPVENTPDTIAG